MKYTVVIERTPNKYAAYVPDLPGCVASTGTRKAVLTENSRSHSAPSRRNARRRRTHTAVSDYCGRGGCCGYGIEVRINREVIGGKQ